MRITTAIAALLLSSAAAFAEVNEECRANDNARVIAGCTTAIQAKGSSRADLVFALVKRGNSYTRTNQLDLAAADLKRAIELDPRNSRAYAARGVLQGARGDNTRALADFNTALQFDPNYGYALAQRATVNVRLGNLDAAKPDLERALVLNPSEATAYSTRGRVNRLQNQLDAALEDFSKAIALDVRWTYPLIQRGETWQLKGDYARAIADFDAVLVLQPGNAEAQSKKQSATALLGQSAPGTRVARTAPRPQTGTAQPRTQAGQPPVAPATPTPEVAALVNEAAAALRRADFDGVIRLSDRILVLNRNSVEAYFLRGQASFLKGDNLRALTDVDRAIELAPREVEAFFLRAQIRLNLGRNDEVVADGDAMVRFAPSDWRGFNIRGLAHLRTERYTQALEEFNAALAVNLKISVIFENRASTLIALNQLAGAERDVEEALKLNARSSRAHGIRGRIHASAGRIDQAAASYQAALAIDPNDTLARIGQQSLLVGKALMQFGGTTSNRRI